MYLQQGSTGPNVATLQSRLNSALTPSPRLLADGVFGNRTGQAVRLFQQRKGLKVDGIVGPITAAALGMSLGGATGARGGGGGSRGGAGPAIAHTGTTGGTGSHPGLAPTGGAQPFVDLSIFNVVIEAAIAGFQKIASALLKRIDSEYVPRVVYNQAAAVINGAVITLAAGLRLITRTAVPLGQDPAAFVTGRIRTLLARAVATLTSALQPLVALPVIGNFVRRYLSGLARVTRVVDEALVNLRSTGQSAQATARQIAQALDEIARLITA